MITSFFQVALQCFNRLISGDTTVVELSVPAIAIMVSTGMVKTHADTLIVCPGTTSANVYLFSLNKGLLLVLVSAGQKF